MLQTHILFLLRKFRRRPERFGTVHGELSFCSGTLTYASPTNRTVIPAAKHMDHNNNFHFPLKPFNTSFSKSMQCNLYLQQGSYCEFYQFLYVFMK